MSMMIFSLLFFFGIFIMFFFILRSQEILLKTLRAELAQVRAKLHILEMRMAGLAGDDLNTDIDIKDLHMEPQQSSMPNINDQTLELSLDPIEDKKP